MVGIIKEVSPDDDDSLGVKEFHDKYFPYDLYRDEDLAFYKFLGKRSIFSLFSWNPFTWGSIFSMSGRPGAKGITG